MRNFKPTRKIIIKLLIIVFYCLAIVFDLAHFSITKWVMLPGIILLGYYYSTETKNFKCLRITPSMVLLFTAFIIYLDLPNNWDFLLHFYSVPFIFFLAIDNKLSSKLTILMVLSLSLMLVFGEFYFRNNSPIEAGRWGEYPALQIDEEIGYSLKPNTTTHLKYNNYDYILKTNSLGFHDDEPQKITDRDSNTYRIFIVGDAFSMPEGMVYQKAYPYLLEQELQKKYPEKKIEILNGGVTGYGPNEYLAQMDKYIDILKPDLIINQFFVNEFDEINSITENRRKSIGFNKFTRLEDAVGYSQLKLNLEKKAKEALNVPNLNYLYFKSLMLYYTKEAVYYNDTVIEKVDKYFANVSNLTAKHNCKFVLLYVPGQIEVSEAKYIDHYPYHLNINNDSLYDFEKPNRIIQQLCEKYEIDLLDSEKTLKSHRNQPVYFPGSWHWNQEGHRAITLLLANYLDLK